jgi:rRNA maturation RNase YbeY
MGKINFHFQSDSYKKKLGRLKERKEWLVEIAETHSFEVEEINYILVSDKELLKINQTALNHDYYTDIITFDLSDKKGIIESDIYISIDRVEENANTFDIPFEEEMNRVLSHGLLHLLGYDDKDEASRQIMRGKEDEALQQYKNKFQKI